MKRHFPPLSLLVLLLVLITGCWDEAKMNDIEPLSVASQQAEIAKLSIENEQLRNELILRESIDLRFLEVREPSREWQELLENYREYEEAITSYHHDDETTYVLIKAPKYTENTGVQFKGFGYKDGLITIYYRFTTDVEEGTDYLIYQLNGIYKVEFIELH